MAFCPIHLPSKTFISSHLLARANFRQIQAVVVDKTPQYPVAAGDYGGGS